MDVKEVRCEESEWILLSYYRVLWPSLVNTVMNLGVPLKVGNFLTKSATVSFSRRTLIHGTS
jgi:hypothetical protein